MILPNRFPAGAALATAGGTAGKIAAGVAALALALACSANEFRGCESDMTCGVGGEAGAGGLAGSAQTATNAGAGGDAAMAAPAGSAGTAGSAGSAGAARFAAAGGAAGSAGAARLAAAAGAAGSAAPATVAGSAGTGTAGSAGAGEAADSAGAAGQAPQCNTNLDCDNANPCDGAETCAAGTCLAGTNPCAGHVADHCEVECSPVDGAPQCSVSPADADGDGHGSALCARDPGLDCDDTDNAVYPGAVEICDGLDNDCNGLSDLEDGLQLGGTPQNLPADSPSGPSIAWAPEAGVYGIVWSDGRHDTEGTPNTEIYFCTVDPSGALVTWPIRVSDAAGRSDSPDIEWGGDAFGVVWTDSRDGTSSVYFRTVFPDGGFATSEQAVTSGEEDADGPTLAFAAEEWHLLWVSSGGQLNVARRTSAGDDLGALVVVDDCFSFVGPNVALLGDQLGLTWVAVNPLGSVWARFSVGAAVAEPDRELLYSAPRYEAAIAANASGWALAWNESGFSALSFAERGPNGSELCTNPAVAVQLVPNTVLPYPGGHLVVGQYTNSAGTQDAAGVRFLSDCARPVDNDVLLLSTTAGVYVDSSDAAGGQQGFAAVWQQIDPDGVTSDPLNTLKLRVFGPRLCDEPTTSAE